MADEQSRVGIPATCRPPPQVIEARKKRRTIGQLAVFLIVGALSTALFFAVYNSLRVGGIGPFLSNAGAHIVTTLFSFSVNRRMTFKVTGRARWMSQLIGFTLVLAATLVLSSGALALLFRLDSDVSRLEENVVLFLASGAFTLLRFWALRRWVFTSG